MIAAASATIAEAMSCGVFIFIMVLFLWLFGFAGEVAGRPLGQPACFIIESFHLLDVAGLPGFVEEDLRGRVEAHGDNVAA